MSKRVIKSVSIPIELDNFLNEHTELSLSKICQSKIMEILENRRFRFAEIEKLKKINSILQTHLQKANEKIEELKGGEK